MIFIYMLISTVNPDSFHFWMCWLWLSYETKHPNHQVHALISQFAQHLSSTLATNP